MSVLLVTWWRRLGWEKIDTWKHPQTTSSYYRWQIPYFCGHVPQESGTIAGGSLNEKTDPKGLGKLINYPLNSAEAVQCLLKKFLSEICAQNIQWRGKVEDLSVKMLIYWTSAAVLAEFLLLQAEVFTVDYSMELQGFS